MRYQGSAAYQLDANTAWEVPVRRSLSVVEGGGLDARRRAAVSPLSGLARLVLTLTVALAVLGAIRVALTAATVSCLRDVQTAESVVAAERVTRTELQVERSALSSADRIKRIATENYGMVYASEVDTIILSEEDAQASADDAQTDSDAAVDEPLA